MPRSRLPYLHKQRTRYDAIVWYVRRDKGPRIRIRGDYGSPEFKAAYDAAMAAKAAPVKAGPSTASLAWLIARYRDSHAWSKITRKTISAGIDRRKDTPFQARHFLQAVRGLFQWAVSAEFITTDPTDGINASLPRTEGFRVWTEAEIDRFEARWPIGSREHLALAILLYTGLRRGDAVQLGRQHIRDGVISMRTEKTGTPVTIPLLPELAEVIAARKTGDLAFIATATGTPMTKESFGFRDACKAAGVPGSAHGLRKAGATRAANNGATVAQLEAIFGWSGGRMASLYTRQADRTRLAKEAMGNCRRGKPRTSIPSQKAK
jgi:integrase